MSFEEEDACMHYASSYVCASDSVLGLLQKRQPRRAADLLYLLFSRFFTVLFTCFSPFLYLFLFFFKKKRLLDRHNGNVNAVLEELLS